jgi:hypothetical protein
MRSLVRGCFSGFLTPQWDTINSLLLPPARRSWLFKAQMPSSGPTLLCPLAQQMALQLLSTSSMMSIANGRRSLQTQDWSLMTIPIQRLSLMTYSPGVKHWTRHCYTSNANFEYANPTGCHSASAKVISFPNASNSFRLTFVWMEIVLLCQSISFLSTGPNLRLFVMLPNLLVLCSFTANSFLSLSFELHHYATSPRSLNTRTLSVRTGLTYHKQPLRT